MYILSHWSGLFRNIAFMGSGIMSPDKQAALQSVRPIKEKGYDIDPEEFLAHYEANGWVQGNDHKTIKSWKACCVTWKKNSKRYDAPNKNSYHDKAYGTDQIVEVGF